MTIKREYGGYTFDVPETVILCGRKYEDYPSYTFHADVAKRWVKNGNQTIHRLIVKTIKSREKKSVVLYQIYRKILSEEEKTKYYKALNKLDVSWHKKTGKWKPVSID